ncbi:putative truncated transcriptional regulator [Kitasatospora setae KM-6054]|uniref:Putative truncated transcriptional regulator n=1 Tax=Kitasatospora setae (strain ATCC 33774 / DSM 43861 / JCM 3304 / KCC A-0304 / NBRC 14216 / KM-6054) TaxID=452652 RepID=E4NJH8_KITSK|nr:putative truncated transcriptional regulator [Kitasatospora setae KM-6054]
MRTPAPRRPVRAAGARRTQPGRLPAVRLRRPGPAPADPVPPGARLPAGRDRHRPGGPAGRRARPHKPVDVAERAIGVRTPGIDLTPEERFEVVGDVVFDLGHATDAHLRWGDHEGHQGSPARAGWRRLSARGGRRPPRAAPARRRGGRGRRFRRPRPPLRRTRMRTRGAGRGGPGRGSR